MKNRRNEKWMIKIREKKLPRIALAQYAFPQEKDHAKSNQSKEGYVLTGNSCGRFSIRKLQHGSIGWCRIVTAVEHGLAVDGQSYDV